MMIRWVKNGSSLRQHRTLALGQMKQWTAASSVGPTPPAALTDPDRIWIEPTQPRVWS